MKQISRTITANSVSTTVDAVGLHMEGGAPHPLSNTWKMSDVVSDDVEADITDHDGGDSPSLRFSHQCDGDGQANTSTKISIAIMTVYGRSPKRNAVGNSKQRKTAIKHQHQPRNQKDKQGSKDFCGCVFAV